MVDVSVFIFFIFVQCLWQFPMVSAVVVGLVRRWSRFDGGFCASWSCFFSLSRSTATGNKINASEIGSRFGWCAMTEIGCYLGFWH